MTKLKLLFLKHENELLASLALVLILWLAIIA